MAAGLSIDSQQGMCGTSRLSNAYMRRYPIDNSEDVGAARQPSVLATSPSMPSWHSCVPPPMKPSVPVFFSESLRLPGALPENARFQILVRTDAALGRGDAPDSESSLLSLPLALEGPDANPVSPKTTTTPTTMATGVGEQSTERTTGGSTIVYYHLLAPEAAVEELKLRWSDLVEPPGAADTNTKRLSVNVGNGVSEDDTPWARRLNVVRDGGGLDSGKQ